MSPCPIKRLIVTGLGRCGTSLAMQMLSAGGMPCVGQFPDFEDTRAGAGNLTLSWLEQQSGAIKILDPMRHGQEVLELPGTAVLWLDRNVAEQGKSQAKFLRHMAGVPVNRKAMRALQQSIAKDTVASHRMLSRLSVSVLRMNFEDLVTAPERAAQTIASWLRPRGVDLHVTRMAYVPYPRPTHCLPDFLETHLMTVGRRLPLRDAS